MGASQETAEESEKILGARLDKARSRSGVKLWLLQKVHVEGAWGTWGTESLTCRCCIRRLPLCSAVLILAYTWHSLSRSPAPNFLSQPHTHTSYYSMYSTLIQFLPPQFYTSPTFVRDLSVCHLCLFARPVAFMCNPQEHACAILPQCDKHWGQIQSQ